MEFVLDWMGEYFNATATARNWTPYWKEILLRRPGDIFVVIRFRLGGPVEVSQSNGWAISKAELAQFTDALLSLLEELGQAMTQQRVADAVQSQYKGASRKVQDDDTILMQFPLPAPTGPLGATPLKPVEMAMIIRPNQTLSIFARCANEMVGQATIRRLLANLQVAGIPLGNAGPITKRS